MQRTARRNDEAPVTAGQLRVAANGGKDGRLRGHLESTADLDRLRAARDGKMQKEIKNKREGLNGNTFGAY